MFNVGIIGSRKPQLVNLYDFELPVSSSADAIFFVRRDGSCLYGPENMVVPGMWWLGAPSVTIGDQYVARITLQAGSVVDIYNPFAGSNGNWGPSLSNGASAYWGTASSGRVLVEIRKVGDTAVLASCRIWRGAAFAP